MTATRRFQLACSLAGLALLILGTVVRIVLNPKVQDFGQYYMGAVIGLEAEWENMYPVPYPDATDNAGTVQGSRMLPRYAELAAERGVGDANRYFHPPPVALLLAPLALLPYEQAHWLWMGLLILAGWRSAAWAGKILEQIEGEPSRLSGWIVFFVAAAPLMFRCVRVSNVSCFVALTAAWAWWGFWKRRDALAGAALTLGGLLKYMPLILTPLLLFARRYRMAAVTASFGCGALLAGLAVMGPGPYERYFTDILPTLRWAMTPPGNQGLSGVLLRTFEMEVVPETVRLAIRAGSFALLAALLWLVWRKRTFLDEDAGFLCAAFCALLSWFAFSGPLFWAHYYVVFAPFVGWLWIEGRQSVWLRAAVLYVLASIWLPVSLFHWIEPPEPLRSHTFFAAVLICALAARRLWLGPASREQSALKMPLSC